MELDLMPRKKQKVEAPGSRPSLLAQLAREPEKLFSAAFRQQYGAVCFRYIDDTENIEVLLISSRDSGRWIVPKGWPMKRKKPYETAEIEAWEEAGVNGVVHKTPVGRYTYLKFVDDGEIAPIIVDLFQIEVTDQKNVFKEKGQRQMAWLAPDEAARRVRELELKSLLVDFTPRGKRRKQEPPLVPDEKPSRQCGNE
ncbi:NUDIX hydrolase [Rhizobium sp. RHZ02]|uniref:NUDIX hydrolase n=1 Tax=Rhizobium sp. RHZ02 TaxID=2769306 RepID=UPI001FEE6B2C|nr:NUDIX hydrolase [Rhizobium sp. RHZ02]